MFAFVISPTPTSIRQLGCSRAPDTTENFFLKNESDPDQGLSQNCLRRVANDKSGGGKIFVLGTKFLFCPWLAMALVYLTKCRGQKN